MKNKFLIIFLLILTFFICCESSNSNVSASPEPAKAGAQYYFDFSVDGKELHIKPEDVTASYRQNGGIDVLKIFAGKEGEPTIVLTIPADPRKPSSTPNGSATEYNMEISQGSVSLQNYPEKNYTSNSFNTTYPEMSVVTPDAVLITASEPEASVARIITGSFNTTTYGSKDSKDPKDSNHKVSGKFKIRHEFSSYNGDKF
ncbi:MAG: hypothetical protein IT257_07025 [Chitinophagaceae bacterium]|nr:hypothetical protein [Chitinophagaceae bacterium]